MKVSVTHIDVDRVTALAAKMLGSVPQAMRDIADNTMDEARRDHSYISRTYNLQDSTFATGPTGTDPCEVVAGSNMDGEAPYDIYVEGRGYQHVVDHLTACESRIEFYCDGIAELIGG